MIIALLFSIAIFLAINMGVSGFSVSFAPSYGSDVLTKRKAVILYTLAVLIGGILIGPRVADTLVHKIALTEFNLISGVIILSASALTMFFSNILKVPQSTSFVTVASFTGAGLYYGQINWQVLIKIFFVAVLFSALSFLFTTFIKRQIYPPHQNNIRFYEKLFIHRAKLRKFIVYTDIYAGFGIGTNNVANVVAPLVFSLMVNPILCFLLISPLFGLGAYLLGGRVIHSVSKQIVPVGEFSASIVSFVTATFMIIASLLGLPTPYVQFTTFALLGISSVKDGLGHTAGKSIVRRILWVWLLIPISTAILSFVFHLLLLKR